jgi:hypothetical protein
MLLRLKMAFLIYRERPYHALSGAATLQRVDEGAQILAIKDRLEPFAARVLRMPSLKVSWGRRQSFRVCRSLLPRGWAGNERQGHAAGLQRHSLPRAPCVIAA